MAFTQTASFFANLINPELRVLVGGEQLVPRDVGKVGRVDGPVVVQYGQGGVAALYRPDVPDLDAALHAGGDHEPRLHGAELNVVHLSFVQTMLPDLKAFN